MATDERLDELRLHWQELQQQGRSVSVAELCAGCPELAEGLERKIETVRQCGCLASFAQLAYDGEFPPGSGR